MKQCADDGDRPRRGVDFFEHGKDEVVVDRVKGFGSVQEQDVVLPALLGGCVKLLIKSSDVI